MLPNYVARFTFLAVLLTSPGWGAEAIPEVPAENANVTGQGKTIDKQSTEAGEEHDWAVESTERAESIHPSNYGQAGIFRVRSAESLPEGALTFGIGGEFYSVTDAPEFPGLSSGSSAKTIAETLFIGYSPVKQLTLGLNRRNSSTTFGTTSQLISSLGDVNFSAMYSFPINSAMVIAPIANILVASNFNSLSPSGNTVSAGLGVAYSFSFYPSTGVPLFLHANLVYSTPQIRGAAPGAIAPETFFNFSRYDLVTLSLGAEYKMGDFIPFLEMQDSVYAGAGLPFGSQPSKVTIGTRITPISNKSLAFLIGADVGLGRAFGVGVPYQPGYQIIGQVSYTVGVNQTERKHYYTTQDVNVIDRKFVIRRNINFKVGSAVLEHESTKLLDQIADVIRENKVKKLLIVGHTDSSHTDDYNNRLSTDRANTVKTYLVKKGIPDDSLMAQGYGKRKPRASNATDSGRALNRRVEFLIVE